MPKPQKKSAVLDMDSMFASICDNASDKLDMLSRSVTDPTEDQGDPLGGVQYGDLSVGQEAEAEVSAVLEAFKDRQKQENKRIQHSIDSEYWCCLCFSTRDEKEAFLKRFNLLAIGDKYLDGRKVERVLERMSKLD